jgi:hypothetical protein
VRFQELRDARLVIQQNLTIDEWARNELERDAVMAVRMASRFAQSSDIAGNPRRSLLHNASFAVWCCLVLSLAWTTPAGASYVELSGIDLIAQSYRIAITNPADGVSLLSALLVKSATLDTTNPNNRNLEAPKGKIYLSLQMTSGPVQRNYRSPLEGQFFSGLTPLPAQALHYVVAPGRSYTATSVNSVNQANNPNAASDDGMVDATYYFVVPITNRRGTLIISPTRTIGVQFEGFEGISTVSLNIGGPTKIPLSFPKKLTATAPAPRTVTPVPGASLANLLNVLGTAFAGLIVAAVLLTKRHRQRRRRPMQAFAASPARQSSPPAHPSVAEPPIPQPRPTPPMRKCFVAETDLRVDVLGPLSISPMLAPASDPVRAIVAYLAINNDRLFTLDEIQTAIWPLTDAGTDIKKPAMRNYMVDVRKTVGEQHLPSASGRAGYQLLNVTTDWTEFQRLTYEATSS